MSFSLELFSDSRDLITRVSRQYIRIDRFVLFADDTSTIISLQGALKFNGGGHINHSIFWQNLCPGGSGEPEGQSSAREVVASRKVSRLPGRW